VRLFPIRSFLALAVLTAASFDPAARAQPAPAAATPGPAVTDAGDLRVLPRPNHVQLQPGCAVPAGAVLAAWQARPADVPEGRELAAERWRAQGIRAGGPRLRFSVAGPAAAEAPGGRAAASAGEARESYRLRVSSGSVEIAGADGAGRFYAAMTLAQLARRGAHGWEIPCVTIEDAPALRWRILSDDVSRGPLPSMRYFEERIRTIAAFKMNGYSPYMEHVFADPRRPLPAPLDGITAAELRTLDSYARRFHVAFVPEQQTFAHMHETLRWEQYAPLAELPHGYLLSPAAPGSEAYVRDLIADELAAVPHPPFFHIGSDEPSDLGRGQSKALVAADGEGPVFAKHVVDTANFVLAHGVRPLIWDDAVAAHPELFAQLPKQLVFVNWHYGSEPSYQRFIDRIQKGGFEQMVAPGALNWNEIYPDLDQAVANIGRFIGEGKRSHVLGLFQTVWHDDGETLFEATWYPVLYAAASAWESGDVDASRFARDFAPAFFGSDDPGYADDFAALGRACTLLRGNPREYGDYLFWADPFDPALASVPDKLDLRALRLDAEIPLAHLRVTPAPPLHANAAAVMFLAARRYDALGRAFQIARESRGYYDDARANIGSHENYVYRGLFVSKYLFWELRDRYLELEPLVRSAWDYENRASHRASVLERYHVAAQRAIERADKIQAVTYDDYAAHRTLPSFDAALGLAAQ
jgi:hexosaminidase